MTQLPEPLRIALLSRVHPHAHAYAAALRENPRAELVGVWDEDAAAGAMFAQQYDAPFVADLDALLAQGLDGVIVASENVLHRGLAEKAAAAGVRAVLCEKPLATSLEDGRAMIDACAARGVKLATAFPCRFSPVFQRLKAAVEAGKLGTILAVRATNHGKCPFGWFTEPEKSGGGAIIDHTVHVADLNRLLLGCEAVEVYAESGHNMFHQPEWEDSGLLTISYASGVFTTLDASWSRPVKSFPTWGDVTMEVVGSAGVAQVDLFRQASVLHTELGIPSTQALAWGSNLDALMVDEFLTLASGGNAPTLATGEDGLAALAVAVAAYESVRTAEPARCIAVAAAS